jgi:hypothetical protein
MSLISFEKIMPVLIVGKTGTGKTTQALEILNNPIVMWANEMISDIYSIPIEQGVLIEDVHYKPDINTIIELLRVYRGQVVMTSINEKDVSSKIKNVSKLKRAGTRKYLREQIQMLAPNSQDIDTKDKDVYTLVKEVIRNPNRRYVADILKHNKPSDSQLMIWLGENYHPNKIAFIDGHVKRNWKKPYFYELIAYMTNGSRKGVNTPMRLKSNRELSNIIFKLGLRPDEVELLSDLLQDVDFRKFAKTKIDNSQWRILTAREKKNRKQKEYFQDWTRTIR